ncbi:MAG TPA: TlpA disulfide reductase family protein [Thermoleophilaceae bacterium]|nr:TlpA disulfide reductase family protein [Thermoleophilaceae bacterium]
MQRLRSPFVIAALIGVTALLGLLVYGLSHTGPDRDIDDSLAKGERKPAPDFDLPRLGGGGRRTLADYRGKVVVLNVWGSWCDPCRSESPLLERWHKRISRDGRGTLLGVDVLDNTPDARAFVREYGLTYPQLKDPSDELRPEYGVAGVPETIVIDPRGRIAAVKRGPVDDAFMRREVAPLVEAGA